MRINNNLKCNKVCKDVNINPLFPSIDINPEVIKLIMISEAPPIDKKDFFYAKGDPYFFNTTKHAFSDAGIQIKNASDLIGMGVYLTTAIKCCKKGYLVSTGTLKDCSVLLEKELDQFINTQVIMLMGDFAIKCINYITKRKHGKSIIPTGSTYRIRNGEFLMNGIRYFPSYTQTGKSYFIEKSKRVMISEDICKALKYLEQK